MHLFHPTKLQDFGTLLRKPNARTCKLMFPPIFSGRFDVENFLEYEDEFNIKLKEMQEMKLASVKKLKNKFKVNKKPYKKKAKKPKQASNESQLMSIRIPKKVSPPPLQSSSCSGTNTDEMISETDEEKMVHVTMLLKEE